MNAEIDALLQKYFDGEITEDQLQSLQQHLQSDRNALDRFVENAFLHDRLRGEFQAQTAIRSITPSPRSDSDPDRMDLPQPHRSFLQSRRRVLTVLAIAASLLIPLLLWRGAGDSALAGVSELKRVIAANTLPSMRVYAIAMESAEPATNKRRRADADEKRPVKPPLDGAKLYVRGKQEFVLIRATLTGEDFVTGCDGQMSWAVAPDGPVRTSSDLGRFNRDVPGHEFAMPLCHLNDALERLQAVADIALLPVEYGDADEKDSDPAFVPSTEIAPRRLLVATKQRGQRGPRRVEITYFVASGLIESVRFVDMPYGPERITVRLSLLPTPSLPDDFFTHQLHHDPHREIESE
jgi:hypothetical protein